MPCDGLEGGGEPGCIEGSVGSGVVSSVGGGDVKRTKYDDRYCNQVESAYKAHLLKCFEEVFECDVVGVEGGATFDGEKIVVGRKVGVGG